MVAHVRTVFGAREPWHTKGDATYLFHQLCWPWVTPPGHRESLHHAGQLERVSAVSPLGVPHSICQSVGGFRAQLLFKAQWSALCWAGDILMVFAWRTVFGAWNCAIA